MRSAIGTLFFIMLMNMAHANTNSQEKVNEFMWKILRFQACEGKSKACIEDIDLALNDCKSLYQSDWVLYTSKGQISDENYDLYLGNVVDCISEHKSSSKYFPIGG